MAVTEFLLTHKNSDAIFNSYDKNAVLLMKHIQLRRAVPANARGQTPKNIIYLPGEPLGCYISRRTQERRLVLMVTYSDLFTFVIMLCAVITLVLTILNHKKQHPCSGKVRCYFLNLFYPAIRCALTNGSLVKYIICQVGLFVKCEKRPCYQWERLNNVIFGTFETSISTVVMTKTVLHKCMSTL